MRTRFHYEIESSGSCGRCKAMIPIGPLRTFRHSRGSVATRCPSCGELELTNLATAAGMLSGWAGVDSLVERARTKDEIERFDHAVRLTESFPHHRRFRGRVGGPERCAHCDQPIAVPPELGHGEGAVVPCAACGKQTHLVPPPRWLVEQSPTWTHLLLCAPATTVRCAACSASVAIGPRVPPEIRCDACGATIAIPPTTDPVPEIDRPRVSARLALTSAAVAAQGFLAATPWVIAALTLLLATGGLWAIVAAARHEAIGGALALAFVAPLLVPLGLLAFVLTRRVGARRRALFAELRRLEEEPSQTTPSTGAGHQP